VRRPPAQLSGIDSLYLDIRRIIDPPQKYGIVLEAKALQDTLENILRNCSMTPVGEGLVGSIRGRPSLVLVCQFQQVAPRRCTATVEAYLYQDVRLQRDPSIVFYARTFECKDSREFDVGVGVRREFVNLLLDLMRSFTIAVGHPPCTWYGPARPVEEYPNLLR